jgi:hypothetical protein
MAEDPLGNEQVGEVSASTPTFKAQPLITQTHHHMPVLPLVLANVVAPHIGLMARVL